LGTYITDFALTEDENKEYGLKSLRVVPSFYEKAIQAFWPYFANQCLHFVVAHVSGNHCMVLVHWAGFCRCVGRF
jgi:hypothetical protein